MQVILRQMFPLGRFHATPWRVNPFDDPYGEWPPSPFRLVRAVIARFHQLARERVVEDSALDGLIRAMVTSQVRFHLPPLAGRGPVLRQYQPGVTLKWNPAGTKDQAKGAMKVSERSLAQDSSFAVPPAQAVYWFLDGPAWTEESFAWLDACLARMTYFGRAESITEISRATGPLPDAIDVNCELIDRRERDAVPVLCVTGDITRATLEATTEGALLKAVTVPPGAVWRYAVRPRKPAPQAAVVKRRYRPTQIVQLALGSSVEPPLSAITTMTGWFRGRVLREALTLLNDGRPTSWKEASQERRTRLGGLSGKNSAGSPLLGHEHARYLMWCDEGRLTRLFVFRSKAFEDWEQEAILRAAQAPLAWTPGKSAGWSVTMVPLDAAVPPPPGFDGSAHRSWYSATPFVPARYSIDTRGRPKKGETIEEQIARELEVYGHPPAQIEVLEDAGWMRVHAPSRATGGHTNNARRSFRMRLTFAEPISGPLALGHSSFFGLGLFRPEPRAHVRVAGPPIAWTQSR